MTRGSRRVLPPASGAAHAPPASPREQTCPHWRASARPPLTPLDALATIVAELSDWRVFRGGLLAALVAVILAPVWLATSIGNHPGNLIIGAAVLVSGSLLGLATVTCVGMLVAWVIGRCLASYTAALLIVLCGFAAYGLTDGSRFTTRALLTLLAMIVGAMAATVWSAVVRAAFGIGRADRDR